MKRLVFATVGVLSMAGLPSLAENIVKPDGFTPFNIVPMMIGQESVAAADSAEYAELTGCSTVLYSLTLHPQGKPAMAKVDMAVESYRRFAAALAGTRARPGILLQAIIGHWAGDAVNRDIEPWQRTINCKGVEKRWCALDERYQDYIRTVGAKLAAEHPCLILGDDDIRSFSPDAECFCPLHLKEYNRRTGLALTQAEFIPFIRDAKLGSKEHTAFTEMQKDTILTVCRKLREGIDSVDPSIPAGVCQPGWPFAKAQVGDYARAIAAKGQLPFARLANGRYAERTPKTDPVSDYLHTQSLLLMFPKDVLALSEADTYPQNTWIHSAAYFHEKLVMDTFLGLKGAKMWYVNAHKAGYPVNRKYTGRMAEHRGYYPALSAAVLGATATGIAIPCHPEFPAEHVFERGIGDPADHGGWGDNYFGMLGIPFHCTFDLEADETYAIAGEAAVGRFSDEQLGKLLSRRLLVDCDAAVAIEKRGFGKHLGVRDSGKKGGYTAEMIEATGAKLSYPLSANAVIFEADPKAETLCSLIWQPFYGSPVIDRVAPSVTLFANELGGRVMVTAFRIGSDYFLNYASRFGEARQHWIYAMLDKLNGRPVENIGTMPQNTFVATCRKDGADLVMVLNANFDAEDEVTLRRAAKPAAVELLGNHGDWVAADWSYADGIVTIRHPLPCYGVCVLRIR